MIINKLKYTFRTLLLKRGITAINILGLAIGFSVFLLIILFIHFELNFDKFHTQSDRIFRVVNVYSKHGISENSATSPFPLAFTLKDYMPEHIKEVVRFYNLQSSSLLIECRNKKYNETKFFFADSTVFSVFDYQFIEGDPSTALNRSGTVVLNKSKAEQYFGKNNSPLGQFITLEEGIQLEVTGVVENQSSQTHLKYDFLASFQTLDQIFGSIPKAWVWNPCWTYVLTHKSSDKQYIESNFPKFVEKYFNLADKKYVSLYLQNIIDIHLHSNLDYELERNSEYIYLYLFSAIGLAVLILASVNYMNLSTAGAVKRLKEISIKKVLGATKKQLINQFLFESGIICLIALIVALFFVEIAIPFVNNFAGLNLKFSTLFKNEFLFILTLLLVINSILSGIYPAIYLAAFKPVRVFKSYSDFVKNKHYTRKILVVIQFTISIVLIISTIVIYKQLYYIKNIPLGFNYNNIIILPVTNNPILNRYDVFKKQALDHRGIISITGMFDIIGVNHNTREFKPEDFPNNSVQFYPEMIIRNDFLETFDIKLVAGKSFDQNNINDNKNAVIINEAMAYHLGCEKPEDAVGKKFSSLYGNEIVIGVVKNFNTSSLHSSISPFVLHTAKSQGEIDWYTKYLAIKINPNEISGVIDHIKILWELYAANRPFKYTLLKDILNEQYDKENTMSKLSLLFTILAIFIATLGILGLSSYITEQKTKEIGIRKVLGATTINIIWYIFSEFLLLTAISNIIAIPLGYFLAKFWLASFVYKTPISWWIFIISGIISLITSTGIVVYHAAKVAILNPSKSLKYE